MSVRPMKSNTGEPNWVRCQTVEEAVRFLGRNEEGKIALRMDHRSVTNSDVAKISRAIELHNTQLQYLSLQDNTFSVDGAQMLAAALAVNRSIRWMYLCGNSLGPDGTRALLQPLRMRQNCVLRVLDLESNNIGHGGALAIAQVLSEALINVDSNGSPQSPPPSGLRELGLGNNNIGRRGAIEIGEALASNTSLNALDLGANAVGSAGACALAEGLRKNKTLRLLELDSNDVGNAGGMAFAEILATEQNTTLLNVGYLHNDRFDDSYLQRIITSKLIENRNRLKGGGDGAAAAAAAAAAATTNNTAGRRAAGRRRTQQSRTSGSWLRRKIRWSTLSTGTTNNYDRSDETLEENDDDDYSFDDDASSGTDAQGLPSLELTKGMSKRFLVSAPPEPVVEKDHAKIEEGRAILRKALEANADSAAAEPQPIPSEYIEYVLKRRNGAGEAFSDTDDKNDGPPVIGRGGFGTVYGVWDTKLFPKHRARSMEVRFAVKEMDLEEASEKQMIDAIQSFRREVNTHLCFKHPNIARLFAYHKSEEMSSRHYLVYELAENGSLYSFLCGRPTDERPTQDRPTFGRERLPWKVRLKISFDVASALYHLHNSGENDRECFHRDIKPENICLTSQFSAKLIDCGLAKIVKTDEDGFGRAAAPGDKSQALFSLMTTKAVMGTRSYLDPDALNEPYRAEFDVFAFGIVLFELLTGILQGSDLSVLGLRGAMASSASVDSTKTTEKFMNLWKLYARAAQKKRRNVLDDLDVYAGDWDPQAAEEMAQLAKSCVDVDLDERPTFAAIAQTLRSLVLKHCSDDLLVLGKDTARNRDDSDDNVTTTTTNGNGEDSSTPHECALCPDMGGVICCRPYDDKDETHWLCRLCFLRTVEEQIDRPFIRCPIKGCASHPFSFQEISDHASAEVLVAHLERRRGREQLERLDRYQENFSALQQSHQHIIKAMQNHGRDLAAVKNALGGLSAGRTAVCPRLVWIVPANQQDMEAFLKNNWGYGLVKKPVKLYFVCEHSHEVVQPPLELNITREFMVHTAFFMKLAMLAVAGVSGVGGVITNGLGPPMVDGALLLASIKALDDFANNALDEKVREYLKKAQKYKDVKSGGGDFDQIQEVVGKAYTVLAEKVRKPKRYLLWKDKIVPVLVDNGNQLVWVKAEYADVLRAQTADGETQLE